MKWEPSFTRNWRKYAMFRRRYRQWKRSSSTTNPAYLTRNKTLHVTYRSFAVKVLVQLNRVLKAARSLRCFTVRYRRNRYAWRFRPSYPNRRPKQRRTIPSLRPDSTWGTLCADRSHANSTRRRYRWLARSSFRQNGAWIRGKLSRNRAK